LKIQSEDLRLRLKLGKFKVKIEVQILKGFKIWEFQDLTGIEDNLRAVIVVIINSNKFNIVYERNSHKLWEDWSRSPSEDKCDQTSI